MKIEHVGIVTDSIASYLKTYADSAEVKVIPLDAPQYETNHSKDYEAILNMCLLAFISGANSVCAVATVLDGAEIEFSIDEAKETSIGFVIDSLEDVVMTISEKLIGGKAYADNR